MPGLEPAPAPRRLVIPNPVTESALENRWPAAHDAEVRRRAEWRRELCRRVGGESGPQEAFCAIAHGRQEAGGGEQGYTADSIQSVLFSTSSMLLPSFVGTSLSVQTMVTSCVKSQAVIMDQNPKPYASSSCWKQLVFRSLLPAVTLLQWDWESHLGSVPSDPTCTSRIADVICNLFALCSRQ